MPEEQKIRVAVVDDEPEGRDVMTSLLSSFYEIDIVAVADGADSGLAAILRTNPDLVFLDIQMPKRSGFDLVRDLSLMNLSPVIVFVTAFDQFAIKAIKLAAFDFLTKPVDPDELQQTISRYKLKKGQSDLAFKVQSLLEQIDPGKKIRFNTRTGFIAVNPDEILYIHADGNYSELYYSRDQKEVISMNIGSVEAILPEKGFFRASRSIIVNLSHVRRIDRKGRSCELLKNNVSVVVEIAKDRIPLLEMIFSSPQ